MLGEAVATGARLARVPRAARGAVLRECSVLWCVAADGAAVAAAARALLADEPSAAVAAQALRALLDPARDGMPPWTPALARLFAAVARAWPADRRARLAAEVARAWRCDAPTAAALAHALGVASSPPAPSADSSSTSSSKKQRNKKRKHRA